MGDESNNNYPLEPKTYSQRWVQLAYLSILALLSDWICFSVAASPDSFEHAYPGASAANLIDIFLFTNVASCFFVTDVVTKFGLGKSIKGAAALMSVGCLMRSGIPDLSWLGGSEIVHAADIVQSVSQEEGAAVQKGGQGGAVVATHAMRHHAADAHPPIAQASGTQRSSGGLTRLPATCQRQAAAEEQ